MSDVNKWLIEVSNLVGISTPHESQEASLAAIKEEIAVLVKNEAEQNNYWREELKRVSGYYRRRVGYIAKLTAKPAANPQERIAQVWRNCDEILRDRERSARLLTALDEAEE